MNSTMLIIYLVIQLIVQYIAYLPIRNLLFWLHSKKTTTITWLPFELFMLNLFVSIFVLVFTGRGGMTGMTNTFASVILGFIMFIQYKIYYQEILSGWYYKKAAKRREINARSKEILAKASMNNKHYYEL